MSRKCLEKKEQKGWLFIHLKSSRCCCSCVYCYSAFPSSFPPRSFAGESKLVDIFRKKCGEGDVFYSKLAVFPGDCPLNHEDIVDWISYLRENEIEGYVSLKATGFKFMEDSVLEKKLQELRNAGTEYLEFTVLGPPDIHDRLVKRNGDFVETQRLARIWERLGGKTVWTLFLHRENVLDYERVFFELAERYGAAVQPAIWSYLGRAVSIEKLRPVVDDLTGLSSEMRLRFWDYRPVIEWEEKIRDGPLFELYPGIYQIVIDNDGHVWIPFFPAGKGHYGIPVGKLPADCIAGFLHRVQECYRSFVNRYPSFRELFKKFAVPDDQRLYDITSLRHLLAAKYDAQSGLSCTAPHENA